MLRGATDRYDSWTLLLIYIITGIGIVMLYSSSADVAREMTGNHMYFLKRQLVRALLGSALLLGFSRIDYHRLKELANWLIIGALILLAFTITFHRLTGANGVARWLNAGPFSLQPSDAARLCLIVYLAAYLDRKGMDIQDFKHGLLPAAVIIALVMTLIVLAPDFSTAALTGVLGLTLLFLGGARGKHLAALGALAMPILAGIMLAAPYRRLRIMTFLGLSDSPQAEYQISQSLISLGHGGWLGQGLGNSVEKKLFLPAPHTDFVFAIIGEELGFIGAVILLGVFFWLFQRGITIAKKAPDRFGMFLAAGIILNVIIYVLVNMAVVTEVLPNTGIPLPLISYGGTHMVFTLMSLGILLNISSSANRKPWHQRVVHAKALS